MNFDQQKAIELINKILIERGISPTKLARGMGKDPSSITTVLITPKPGSKTAPRKLSLSNAKDIAKFLGYDSIIELIEKNDIENSESNSGEENGRLSRLEDEVLLLKTLISSLIDKMNSNNKGTIKK